MTGIATIGRIHPSHVREELTAVEPLARAGAIIGVPEQPRLGPEAGRAVPERYAVTTGEMKR